MPSHPWQTEDSFAEVPMPSTVVLASRYGLPLDTPPEFVWGYADTMRMDSVRPSCMECVEKHLGAALVLMGEAESGYPEHKLLAIGHLHEAAEESADMRPELSALLRDIRKRYQQGEAIEFESILEALNQHGVWRFDQRGQGVACGKGWIPRSKKCSRDKAAQTSKEAKAKTVEKAKARAELKRAVKAGKGQKAYVKPKPAPQRIDNPTAVQSALNGNGKLPKGAKKKDGVLVVSGGDLYDEVLRSPEWESSRYKSFSKMNEAIESVKTGEMSDARYGNQSDRVVVGNAKSGYTVFERVKQLDPNANPIEEFRRKQKEVMELNAKADEYSGKQQKIREEEKTIRSAHGLKEPPKRGSSVIAYDYSTESFQPFTVKGYSSNTGKVRLTDKKGRESSAYLGQVLDSNADAKRLTQLSRESQKLTEQSRNFRGSDASVAASTAENQFESDLDSQTQEIIQATYSRDGFNAENGAISALMTTSTGDPKAAAEYLRTVLNKAYSPRNQNSSGFTPEAFGRINQVADQLDQWAQNPPSRVRELWKTQPNRTDSYLQGYLEVMSWRFDRKGEGVACGRGWISRRKKCGRDKSRTTSPEAKARTVEKQKVRQQLRGQVKAAKGMKPYVKPKPEPTDHQGMPHKNPKTPQEFIENGRAVAGAFLANAKKLDSDIAAQQQAVADADRAIGIAKLDAWKDATAKVRQTIADDPEYQKARKIQQEKSDLEDEAYEKLRRNEISIREYSQIEQEKNRANSAAGVIRERKVNELIEQNPAVVKAKKARDEAQQKLAALSAPAAEFKQQLISTSTVSRADAESRAKKVKKPAKAKDPGLSDQIADFNQLTNGAPTTLNRITITKQRAHATRDGLARYYGPGQDRRALWHEMAHHLEFADPAIAKVAEDWVKSRATGPQESLRKLTGNNHYDRREKAYPDHFADPYAGKVYSDGMTEVLSMGLEVFSSPERMIQLAAKDPDHFALVLGLMRRP